MGDLPNVYASADGVVKAEVFSALVSFTGAGGRPALRDADGSALVVHASADDYTTQPIGGAGGRVACAVIK
jgi:Cu-Zn family superoxide dismutase